VFDFDGTIIRGDSTTAFCRAEVPAARLVAAVLGTAPRIAVAPLSLAARARLKESLLTALFGGREAGHFRTRATEWALEHLPGMVRPDALDRLRWHQRQGHRVVLASGSLELLLEPWASVVGVPDVLATRLEVREGRLTGRLHGPNCYGPEKVARLRQLVGGLDGLEVYAYGDSRGDRELLAAARHPAYRAFHGRPAG
jgi:phosphatidylglycerophosphatase C